MVRGIESTRLDATQLGVWTRVDHALLSDGYQYVVGLENQSKTRSGRRFLRLNLCHPVGLEFSLDACLFLDARIENGIRHHRSFMVCYRN